MKTILTREQVPVQLTWRLEDIFATNEAWEQEFKEVTALSDKATSFQGTLSNGSAAMLQTLRM